MRILIIKTFPKEIKTSHLTYNVQEIGLAVALKKSGHVADVLCCSDDGENRESVVEQEGMKVMVYARKSIRVLQNGWPLNVDNLLNCYDVLQPAEYNQIYSWHLAKKFSNKTVIYHGPYYCSFNKNYNLMAKVFDIFFLSRYKKYRTRFITKSKLAKKYLQQKGLENIDAVGVGLNTSFLDGSSSVNDKWIQQVKACKELKLLYIGVLEERRNTIFLLKVLSEVHKLGVDAKLVIVGKFSDEKYKIEFQSTLHSLQLAEYVFYRDCFQQNQLPKLYQACDIFLFPTRYDIYGMVLLEAMYFGLPVISTMNGGAEMMIVDTVNGFVIDDYNAVAWAEKVKYISQNLSIKKSIGLSAKTTITDKFVWDKLVNQFITVYENTLSQ